MHPATLFPLPLCSEQGRKKRKVLLPMKTGLRAYQLDTLWQHVLECMMGDVQEAKECLGVLLLK